MRVRVANSRRTEVGGFLPRPLSSWPAAGKCYLASGSGPSTAPPRP
jgi:hypothetical protein